MAPLPSTIPTIVLSWFLTHYSALFGTFAKRSHTTTITAIIDITIGCKTQGPLTWAIIPVMNGANAPPEELTKYLV
jgi:hypothetical protein